ncbi:LOW QUALITY PROTEIN: integrin alpha-PS3-like [Haematobia irritans]|uniref:LOW QUALITY PROTEIN: integrin alpha-PS3-like n=1 Tax=Haematobia irritans TaxID=7368 RepID=UPI003F5024C2
MLKATFCAILILVVHPNIEAYNLSPKPNVIINDPQLPTVMPKYESSYFGFTLNLRKQCIIVGAPRAQSTLKSQSHINETGAIYRCSFQSPTNCFPYVFEPSSNIVKDNAVISEQRDFQWLGASMDGGNKDTDKLVVCAPRLMSHTIDYQYIRGICYWINDTMTEIPYNVTRISPMTNINYQILRNKNGHRVFYFMLAQQGISVQVSPNREEFVIGAPGINSWSGSVIRYHTATHKSDIPNPKTFEQGQGSYLGYSVDSGYFDSNNRSRLMYLASAPRANKQSGETYIYDYNIKHGISKYFVCRGLQFGEYFGYAVLAEDINGDGLTDVIVSAPHHALTESYEDGAIYVFINLGRFRFERKLIVSPRADKGRFGTTLSKLGDIDLDGFNDIAVGAPFAQDGCVFVYMGSRQGLRMQPSQRLDYPKSRETKYGQTIFGHGLSRGSDIDGNGYNDLAVGAPNAEEVFVYKSYPVVSIVATIAPDTREIIQEQTSFQVLLCYQIATNSPLVREQKVALHLVIDPQVKRVYRIESIKSNQVKMNVTASQQKQCRNLNCYVRFSPANIFKPIQLELTYELVHQITDSEIFCEHCAVVDPYQPKKQVERVIFNTGCKSEVCVADIRVTSKLNHTYILGSSRFLSITYDVFNNGETAYLPQINITSSNRMPFAKVPSHCKHNKDESILLCDLNQGQSMKRRGNDSITVTYDTSGLSRESIHVMANVFSTGKESNSADNSVTDTIALQELAEVNVVGEVMTSNINLDDRNTSEIINMYKIKSGGPSTISSIYIVFDIPVNYTYPDSEEVLPIVNTSSISMLSTYDSQIIPLSDPHFEESHAQEELFDIDIRSSTSRRRKRRDAISYENHQNASKLLQNFDGTFLPNRTIVLNCNNTARVQCVRTRINILDFKPDIPLEVEMKYQVHVSNRKSSENSREFLVIQVDVDIQTPKDRLDSTVLKIKKLPYNLITKHQKHRNTPFWVYALAATGGLLILTLVTYVLYIAGFFKRTKKEEMEKLIQASKNSKNVNPEDGETCAQQQ